MSSAGKTRKIFSTGLEILASLRGRFLELSCILAHETCFEHTPFVSGSSNVAQRTAFFVVQLPAQCIQCLDHHVYHVDVKVYAQQRNSQKMICSPAACGAYRICERAQSEQWQWIWKLPSNLACHALSLSLKRSRQLHWFI